MTDAPRWIRTPEDMGRLAATLARARAVSIDTEADSLHHYPGKLCLVQIATDAGEGHLVDPLLLADLSALGPCLADPGIVKVLHAADNDLAYLKRLHPFTVASIFDTAIAARFLGVTALGLDELLKAFIAVDPGKSRQKDDWSRRPLTAGHVGSLCLMSESPSPIEILAEARQLADLITTLKSRATMRRSPTVERTCREALRFRSSTCAGTPLT